MLNLLTEDTFDMNSYLRKPLYEVSQLFVFLHFRPDFDDDDDDEGSKLFRSFIFIIL